MFKGMKMENTPPPRRNSIAALFLIVLFVSTICMIPLVVMESDEPLLVVEPAPTLAPLPGSPNQPQPALVFPQPVNDPAPAMIVHVMQHDENLNDVARLYGVTIQDLVAVNPGLLEQNIMPGTAINIRPEPVVVIPATGGADPTLFIPSSSGSGQTYHAVQPGETLAGIAARYGVTTQALLSTNPLITDPDRLTPGDILLIPSPALLPVTGSNVPPADQAVQVQKAILYTVRQGDTLFAIATAHRITLQSLLEYNPQVTDPALIFPGDQVIIPISE
jgi:LysM repeat protein